MLLPHTPASHTDTDCVEDEEDAARGGDRPLEESEKATNPTPPKKLFAVKPKFTPFQDPRIRPGQAFSFLDVDGEELHDDSSRANRPSLGTSAAGASARLIHELLYGVAFVELFAHIDVEEKEDSAEGGGGATDDAAPPTSSDAPAEATDNLISPEDARGPSVIKAHQEDPPVAPWANRCPEARPATFIASRSDRERDEDLKALEFQLGREGSSEKHSPAGTPRP